MRIYKMRQPRSTPRLAFLSGIAVCLFSAAGCGTGSSAPPSDEVARTALEKALTTWRDGGKPGSLKGVEPTVQVNDTPWSQGERLGSYEILKEDTGAAEKRFTVRLSLMKPERVEEVQYYVLGKEPVMVFRDQDYLRNINMEEGPKLNSRGTSKRTRKR
jgi:hypothetical protein